MVLRCIARFPNFLENIVAREDRMNEDGSRKVHDIKKRKERETALAGNCMVADILVETVMR
jgi:hypothetical protein